MKIKKLELVGFKSFVDRTILHFDHDVLGIVGPNGCGKSNIVDAIRWCMGEQSARHLRGRSMEDIIFNGSETRGAHDFAEVTITFVNDSPDEMPLEYKDYAEVAVTRRLYRSGESEYLINKTAVRLRDQGVLDRRARQSRAHRECQARGSAPAHRRGGGDHEVQEP
jgi:chromosome segregation protein